MHFQYIPYLWLLGISLIILLFLAFFSLRYRKVKGAKAFAVCMLNFAFWTACNALEMAGVDLQTKLFWANMQYFSYATIHICWLYMVLQFTGAKKWTRPRRILPLLIIPAIVIILVWTDQYHGLIRNNFSLDTSGSFPVVKKSYGPLYWIHPIYGYSIEILSVILIARAAFTYKSIYRMQAVALLVSPIISIVPSVLYVLSLSPIKGYDITPVFLGVSGLVAAVGLFRYQLFAAAPVAREAAVDNMNIGMVVIDSYGNIADVNSTARKLLGKDEKALLGSPSKEVLTVLDIPWNELTTGEAREYTITPDGSGQEHYYEIQRLPVFSKLGIQAGNVILIRDVTEIRLARNYILEQNSQLAASREREKLARDLHDNLGQVLAFINLQAQGIRKEIEHAGTDRLREDLTKLIDVSQSAHREIREFINDVRNPYAGKKDFMDHIASIVEAFEEQTGKKISLNIEKSEELGSALNNYGANIVYIIKEALNNIRKHAGEAANAGVSLRIKNGQLLVDVEDDGSGFDSFSGSNHYGLKIMRERTAEIGAQLQIQSEPGRGTCIRLSVPIDNEGEAKPCEDFAGR